MRSAAATASSTVVTASPGDTGMSNVAKNCLPWYSKRSTGRQATDPPPRQRKPTPATTRSRRARGSSGRFPLAGVEGVGQPVGDGAHRGAGREDAGDPRRLERRDVGLGDDAAAEHQDVVEP